MEKLFDKKYREIILYLFFGVCTTVVNFISYFLLSYLGTDTFFASLAAWIISVIFAFITNRRYVFESKNDAPKEIFREFYNFLLSRSASGALDIGIMVLFVDYLHFNELLIKLLSNIIVIVMNYILSKLWIFKKEEKADE